MEEQKRIKVINYYESLFRDEEIKTINIYNNIYNNIYGNIFDFRWNIIRAIENWSANKAPGPDQIPGSLFKNKIHKMVLASRLANHFKEYLIESDIPRYFMEAKLILISKDGTEYPKV